MPLGDVLSLRGVSIGYDGPAVMTGVDLDVGRGDVVALLGPNGSGKSTLVRGVLGLARVTAGEIRLFGTPVARFRERWLVGYVPQRYSLSGGVPATVREVVSAGRLSRRRVWRRLTAEDRAHVSDAIATVGLPDQGSAPVGTLSGGQQRRVLVARALAAQPELLILDEPTAGVDAASQELLAQTLADLASSGSTIVLVTHELGPFRPIVTRSVVLGDGAIVYDGAPGDAPVGPDHDHHHDPDEGPARRPAIGLSG